LSVLGIVAAQIILGALTVQLELTPALVVMHLGLATLFLAVRLVQAVGALRGAADALPASPSLHRLVQAAAAATYLMILIGGYVAASGAGLACPDVPLCRGAALLPPGPGARMHMLQRRWSLVVVALLLLTPTPAPGAAPAVGAPRRRGRDPRLRGADEAADHHAPAHHHGDDDADRGAAPRRARGAAAHAPRRDARGRVGQRLQHVHRPGHRRADAADLPP